MDIEAINPVGGKQVEHLHMEEDRTKELVIEPTMHEADENLVLGKVVH